MNGSKNYGKCIIIRYFEVKYISTMSQIVEVHCAMRKSLSLKFVGSSLKPPQG